MRVGGAGAPRVSRGLEPAWGDRIAAIGNYRGMQYCVFEKTGRVARQGQWV